MFLTELGRRSAVVDADLFTPSVFRRIHIVVKISSQPLSSARFLTEETSAATIVRGMMDLHLVVVQDGLARSVMSFSDLLLLTVISTERHSRQLLLSFSWIKRYKLGSEDQTTFIHRVTESLSRLLRPLEVATCCLISHSEADSAIC